MPKAIILILISTILEKKQTQANHIYKTAIHWLDIMASTSFSSEAFQTAQSLPNTSPSKASIESQPRAAVIDGDADANSNT
ncbi:MULTISPECIES: hypothetical protein [unclassified Synechococcus]|uniref:hypothetical protein n=1 Tax=unclassified Synechococcus TaxID=2626047 RepID=UPI0008352911|nr:MULTISPECIES: hypothetical protein [unclassified Synechococcus]